MTSAKQAAIQAAKKIAQEPLEILKKASEQVGGTLPQAPSEETPSAEVLKTQVSPEEKAKIEVQGQRQVQALEVEIADIEREKMLTDLQGKIAAGEEVSLTNIPELTREQIEVLKAQQLAVSARKEAEAKAKPLEEPKTKHSRRLRIFGPKAQAEREKTHVEKPLPP